MAGLRPATRYEAVCVGTSAAGSPHEAGGQPVAFRTRAATVTVARVTREGEDVAATVAGTLELPARCVAFDANRSGERGVRCSGDGGRPAGEGRGCALLRVWSEGGVDALHDSDGGGDWWGRRREMMGSVDVDGLRGDPAVAQSTSHCGFCASMCLSGNCYGFCACVQNKAVGQSCHIVRRPKRVPIANYPLEDIEARSLLSLMEQYSRSCSPIPQE